MAHVAVARTVKIAARPVLHLNDYLMIIFILTTVLPAFLLKKQTIRVFNDEYLSIKQNNKVKSRPMAIALVLCPPMRLQIQWAQNFLCPDIEHMVERDGL